MHERELRDTAWPIGSWCLSTFSRAFETRHAAAGQDPHRAACVQVDAVRPPAGGDRGTQTPHSGRRAAPRPLRRRRVVRKGFLDIASAIDTLSGRRLRLRARRPILPECAPRSSSSQERTFVGKRPQAELPPRTRRRSISLSDDRGRFPAVMAQAKAAALPILTTAHGAGLDIGTPLAGRLIVPVRDPAAIVDRLSGARQPSGSRRIVQRVYDSFRPRDWAQVAADFERFCVEATPPVADRSRPLSEENTPRLVRRVVLRGRVNSWSTMARRRRRTRLHLRAPARGHALARGR